MSELGEQIIAKTRRVAAERPNFVYRSMCAYVVDGEPGCLIGHALWDLGLIDEDFEGCAENKDGIDGIDERLGLNLGSDEHQWLCDVQDAQDRANRWGICIEAADAPVFEEVEEVEYYEDDEE